MIDASSYEILTLSLSRESKTHKGEVCQQRHSINYFRSANSCSQANMMRKEAQHRNVSMFLTLSLSLCLPPNQCQSQCHRSVSVAALLVTTSVVWPRHWVCLHLQQGSKHHAWTMRKKISTSTTSIQSKLSIITFT